MEDLGKSKQSTPEPYTLVKAQVIRISCTYLIATMMKAKFKDIV